MTEVEARAWILDRFGVSREAMLARYVDLLVEGAAAHNLISKASIDAIWARHIVDSAQLVGDAPDEGVWVDIGSGAGLPGIVVAICRAEPVVLIEPRNLRAQFLEDVVAALDLSGRVSIAPMKSQNFAMTTSAAVISARGVAALPALIASAIHLTGRNTVWLLPKGRDAQSEVANARKAWHGVFHVKPSITDPTSGIVLARGVYRR
jgi:16S rRNA (guanine527-N7)-methyltransferase